MLQALAVFAAAFILDIVWARYTAAVAGCRRLVASSYSMGIVAIGAFTFISYVDDLRMIIPAMAGAFCGTFVGMKSQPEPKSVK